MKFSRTRPAVLGLGLIATALALPSVATATAEPVWGNASVVEFATGVHSPNGGGEIKSIVCSSPGNCTAVG